MYTPRDEPINAPIPSLPIHESTLLCAVSQHERNNTQPQFLRASKPKILLDAINDTKSSMSSPGAFDLMSVEVWLDINVTGIGSKGENWNVSGPRCS